MINGLTHIKNTSDKFCPRCGQKTVRRDLRKCIGCNGRLIWDGDDAMNIIKEMDWFYCWHKTPYGVTGWFDASYFQHRRDNTK